MTANAVRQFWADRLIKRYYRMPLILALCLVHIEGYAQIQADKNAPANQRPMVVPTQNGIPQVNIQTPSAQGVSMNQYSQMDVDKNGAILNNSRVNTNTHLAGHIQGNPYLARGEAKVIVNQVNSRNPSHINGVIEVAGKRADVVIANPSGLSINGAGFINAQGVTLTTGNTTLSQQGVLLDKAQGNIVVGNKGLNAGDADYVKFINQAMSVEGQIGAQTIDIESQGGGVYPTGRFGH